MRAEQRSLSKPCDLTKKHSALIGLCGTSTTSGYILVWPKNIANGNRLCENQAERSEIFSV